MLAHVWQELKVQVRLDAASDADLDALLALAADHAIGRLRQRRPDAIGGRFAELEQARLVRLVRAWLEIERERPPFEVAAIETEARAELRRRYRERQARPHGYAHGIRGAGQGGHAIIDYKTGSASVGDWLGPRPDDPPVAALRGEPGRGARGFRGGIRAREGGRHGVQGHRAGRGPDSRRGRRWPGSARRRRGTTIHGRTCSPGGVTSSKRSARNSLRARRASSRSAGEETCRILRAQTPVPYQ